MLKNIFNISKYSDTRKITRSYRFIIIFFFMLKNIFNISKYSTFNSFNFFSSLKRILISLIGVQFISWFSLKGFLISLMMFSSGIEFSILYVVKIESLYIMLLKMAFKNNIFKLIWVTFKQYFESKFYELCKL